MINTTPLRKKLLDLAFSGKLVPKTGEWKTVKLGDIGKWGAGLHHNVTNGTLCGVMEFAVVQMER